MSGTMVGVVDAVTSGTGADAANEVFTYTKLFFDRQIAVGQAELVASNFGFRSVVGLGLDFWDTGAYSKDNAWFVIRMLASASSVRTTDFYVLVQWSYSASWGASPGNPALLDNVSSGTGVAIMMAYREDGGNPWNGTSNADGADTKGTPVWAGTGLHLMTTAPGDNAEQTHKAFVATGSNDRYFLIGDADTFFFTADETATSEASYFVVMGCYTPMFDLSPPNPYFMATTGKGFSSTNSWGGYANNLWGGLITAEADGVQEFLMCSPPENFELGQPAIHGAFSAVLDFPIYMMQTSGASCGITGYIPPHLFTALINGSMTVPASNTALDRAFIQQDNTSPFPIYSIAWGGGVAPFTGTVRAGRTF